MAVVRSEMASRTPPGSQRLSQEPRHGLGGAALPRAGRGRLEARRPGPGRSETKVEPLCQFCVSWHMLSWSVPAEIAEMAETDDKAKTSNYADFTGLLRWNEWCCQTGLNCRPLHYQWSALPLSYGSMPGSGESAQTRALQAAGSCHNDPSGASTRQGQKRRRRPKKSAESPAFCFNPCNSGPIRFPVSSVRSASALSGPDMASNSIILRDSSHLKRRYSPNGQLPILAENPSVAS